MPPFPEGVERTEVDSSRFLPGDHPDLRRVAREVPARRSTVVIRSPFPDVEIPDVSLTDFVLARAAELGDKPAFIDAPSGRTISYVQLVGSPCARPLRASPRVAL